MTMKTRLQFATKIASRHLLISVFVALLSAAFVFFALYPYPFYAITGSLSIFILMMGVDVSCGPLCSFIIASPKKSKRETITDLTVIGAIQLLALGYGLFTLYTARPVMQVYERGNFRIVTANEVQINEFSTALPAFQQLPLVGINTIGTREAKNPNDQLDSVEMSLAGIEIGLRPSWWVSYQSVRDKVKKTQLPIDQLMNELNTADKEKLTKAIKKYHLKQSDTFFLPLDNAKYKEWVVLLNNNADIVGYAPVDGYVE